ncbi:hypothetical protein HPO96_03935 [Kribbella sandramycini]|uniref:DUF1453 domain-containing protein n=1 Tax=Kribbella sandramycini TaxID=60450 RepID=A0A7Y4KVB9_9ACTN|nr:hypothetical protein [Kribbella sandramycini]MBB6568016.1 hypothetical protein [Kribbella sandramycini]NOL39390.1 hypothetical protein [Kribbella sandramycini]
MSFGTLPNALVVVAIVAAVVVRRLRWSELENSDADVWRGPLILMGVGVYQLYGKHLGLGPIDLTLLIAGVGVALAAGFLAGRVAQVERRAGKVFYRLGLPGLGIMVAYLVVRLGLAGLGHLVGAASVGGGALLLSLGANLLTQSTVIQSRAHHRAEEYSTS